MLAKQRLKRFIDMYVHMYRIEWYILLEQCEDV